MSRKITLATCVALVLLMACDGNRTQREGRYENRNHELTNIKMAEYAEVPLYANASHLNSSERLLMRYLMEAADIFDDIYWVQSFGDRSRLDSIRDLRLRKLAYINYGPWEKLCNYNAFVEGYSRKIAGHNFYPDNMTVHEFAAFNNPDKTSPYTMIRRDIVGNLRTIPYCEYFRRDLMRAANLIRSVTPLSSDTCFTRYLELLADALLNDRYAASNKAWMACYSSPIDFIAGPIDNADDMLFGFKNAYMGILLLREPELCNDIQRINCLVPALQERLPCDNKYKFRPEHCQADYGVYDVLYLAGQANAPFVPMVFSLPNSRDFCATQGRRKIVCKNIVDAKFNAILKPIAELLIAPEQANLVCYRAFFSNTVFRDLTYGPIVSKADLDTVMAQATTTEYIMDVEEARSDISAIFVAQELEKMGELRNVSLRQCYVTFLADVLRKVRFGTGTASGRANMLILGYLQNTGAVERTAADKYRINFSLIENCVNQLMAELLNIQIQRNYAAATVWIASRKFVEESLFYDLLKLVKAKVPRDIRARQGHEVIGI